MSEITQKKLAKLLGLKKSKVSQVLSGKVRIRRDEAHRLEGRTGIDRIVWMDGEANEILFALEEEYGTINFKRGRPVGKKV